MSIYLGSSDAGSIAVKADTVNDEDEVGSNSNSVVRNCNAISFRLGYNRDSASANAFDVPGTNTTVKCSSCIAMNHLATIEVGFCFIFVMFK